MRPGQGILICNGVTLQNQRPSNMDSFFCQYRREGSVALAVVCDGVGSLRDGAFASEHCTRQLARWFSSAPRQRMGLSLRDQVLSLNDQLLELARQRRLETATTLSALLLTEEQYVAVHIGDSRIYSYCDNVLHKLTIDDTSDSGKLTGCIGRWTDIQLHYEEGQADAQGYLLCSDGLYKGLTDEQIGENVAQLHGLFYRRRLWKMVNAAVSGGSRDNITAVLLKRRK